jgi:hypothetical protein|tara:strand:- start:39 stop:410 length:372 start_codon:yes stop_codon:yes gene_type:complete
MNLSLIFRLLAAFNALWAVQLIFMPNMMIAMYGWAPSIGLYAIAQAAGTAMLGLAIIAYGLPNWTSEEQLKTAAKSVGLVAALFVLLQLYQILISGAAPGAAMDWISTAITALFAIGLFAKSR